MITYKLLRIKNGRLYPLFVETNRELPTGIWLEAGVGELADATHVKSKLGPLSLRPGWHSCTVPYTDWIGKKQEGILVQRKDTVWCECLVEGEKIQVNNRYGLRVVPSGWYYFKTKAKQPFPWIISDRIFIRRIISYDEVQKICLMHNVKAQPLESEKS